MSLDPAYIGQPTATHPPPRRFTVSAELSVRVSPFFVGGALFCGGLQPPPAALRKDMLYRSMRKEILGVCHSCLYLFNVLIKPWQKQTVACRVDPFAKQTMISVVLTLAGLF